jgi:hypothetical protein
VSATFSQVSASMFSSVFKNRYSPRLLFQNVRESIRVAFWGERGIGKGQVAI